MFSPILVYNVDRTLNKVDQISEVVNIVLQYKTHADQTLLVVSSLSKQNLILEFTWLKSYNSNINWYKGDVLMTYYPSTALIVRKFVVNYLKV